MDEEGRSEEDEAEEVGQQGGPINEQFLYNLHLRQVFLELCETSCIVNEIWFRSKSTTSKLRLPLRRLFKCSKPMLGMDWLKKKEHAG